MLRIYFHPNSGFFLIEFKNGKIEARENYEINVKILESLHIFTEKVVRTTAFPRDNLTFILVYNESLEHGEKQFENTGIDMIKRNCVPLPECILFALVCTGLKNSILKMFLPSQKSNLKRGLFQNIVRRFPAFGGERF